MDYTAIGKQVTCIVPAFNEGPRLAHVLQTLTTFPFAEVIVVDDGSTDHSAEVAHTFPVKVIVQKQNQGKAMAMDVGVQSAQTPYIFFCDADVVGLTHATIAQICNPVVFDEYEMCIGMRNRKIFVMKAILHILPLLGGERCLSKALWKTVPMRYKERFQIEAALNFYAKYYGRGFTVKVFRGLSQVIKEKKYGVRDGFVRRIAMIRDILVAGFALQKSDIPGDVANMRRALRINIVAVFFLGLGCISLLCALVGPFTVFGELIVEELRQDPTSAWAHGLQILFTVLDRALFGVLGIVLITVNFLTILSQSARLFRILRKSRWRMRDLFLKSDLKTKKVFHE